MTCVYHANRDMTWAKPSSRAAICSAWLTMTYARWLAHWAIPKEAVWKNLENVFLRAVMEQETEELRDLEAHELKD